MATQYLNDGRARPLGHGTLRIRRNHLVVGSDQVPARLGLPRRFADLAAESLHAPWDLGVGHERGFFRVHVGREGGAELHPVEEQIAVLRRQYRRYGRAGRRILGSVATDSPLSGAKAVIYTSPATLGSFPASVITAPP